MLSAFAKTLIASVSVGFFVVAALILSTPVSSPGVAKVMPLVIVAAGLIGTVASWPLIAVPAWIIARTRNAAPATIRELRFAVITSVSILAGATAIYGAKHVRTESFRSKLERIDNGTIPEAQLMQLVDECMASSGGAVLGEQWHVLGHISVSTHTPAAVLDYIIEQGDISEDFWSAILVNPNTTERTKSKIAKLRDEALTKWGGVMTDERLRSRTRRYRQPR